MIIPWLVKILLFRDRNHSQAEESHIIHVTIKYLVKSERFNGPLL